MSKQHKIYVCVQCRKFFTPEPYDDEFVEFFLEAETNKPYKKGDWNRIICKPCAYKKRHTIVMTMKPINDHE